MRRTDFCALTLPEFSAAYSRLRERTEQAERLPWEMMRVQVAMTIQPFVKAKLNPKKIFPLPWDNDNRRQRRKTQAQRKKELAHRQARLSHYLATGEWEDPTQTL